MVSVYAINSPESRYGVQRVPFKITSEPLRVSFEVSQSNPCWRVWANNNSIYDLELIVYDENGNLIDSQTIIGNDQSEIQGFYSGTNYKETYEMVLASKRSHLVEGVYSWKVGRNFNEMSIK